MSFILQIYERPDRRFIPASLAEAVRQVDELQRERGGNPKFPELAGRLTSRFPCITSPESDDLDESELAWTDGPLDGETDGRVYAIGLGLDLLDQVRPFVIEQARKLGLSVLDPQAGECWLEDGTCIGIRGVIEHTQDRIDKPGVTSSQPGRIDSRDATRFVPQRNVLLQQAEESFADFLHAENFKRVDDPRGTRLGDGRSYRACFAGGEHTLTIWCVDREPVVELSIAVASRLEAVGVEILALQGLEPSHHPLPVSAHVRHKHWAPLDELTPGPSKDFNYVAVTGKQESAVLATALRHLHSGLKPLLRRLETVEGLDGVLNQRPLSQSLLPIDETSMRYLVAARLANNPGILALADELEALYELYVARWQPAEAEVRIMREHFRDERRRAGQG